MKAPEWFVKEMSAFDPALRVRWSKKMNIWQLERKIANSKVIDTSKRDGFDDDYIRAKDGYILVALIEHGKFSRDIFSVLKASDLWSHGGWECMARYIEEKEAMEEEKRWKDFSDDLKYRTAELYNFFKIREGSRILNIGYPR
jgi:hypothetical protein